MSLELPIRGQVIGCQKDKEICTLCFPKVIFKMNKTFDPPLKGISAMPSPEKQQSGSTRAVGITHSRGCPWSHGLPGMAMGSTLEESSHRPSRWPFLGTGAGSISSPVPRANTGLGRGSRGIPWQRDRRNVKVSFNININPSEVLQERTVPREGCPGGRWARRDRPAAGAGGIAWAPAAEQG